jgi:hypothetical protein
LSLLREKSIILNDPLPAETAMVLEHGLKIIEPKDIPNAKVGLLYFCAFEFDKCLKYLM